MLVVAPFEKQVWNDGALNFEFDDYLKQNKNA